MTDTRGSRRNFLTSAATGLAGIGILTIEQRAIAQDGGRAGNSASGRPRLAELRDDLNSRVSTIASQADLPPPFQVALPIPPQLVPRKTADTDYYEIVQTVARKEILPGLQTTIWGYNGIFPGPTIVSSSGRRTVVNHRNELPVPSVVHLHGGRTPPDDDGYPTDFIMPVNAAPGTVASMSSMPGMVMPGKERMSDANAHVTQGTRDYVFPLQQRAATLWYHDHRMDFTGASVYRGLAGFHIVQDAEEMALPLPKGERDIPLMICDRAFAADGSLIYPSIDPTLQTTPGVESSAMNGVMGDIILVNGAPWPELKVVTARYRFRMLNASNARTYSLALQADSASIGFTQIGTDGGLLAAPVQHDSIVIAPAQRFDVIIDFSKFKIGDQVTMNNLAGTGTTATVMRFTVSRAETDTSSIPDKLSVIEAIDPGTITTKRTMRFRWQHGEWLINEHAFDPAISEATVKLGTTELWTVWSDFHHPVHIHLAKLQVISRNGGPPSAYDTGWKDTVNVNVGENVVLAVRFDGYRGRYIFHCHNLEHEDMAMMANYHIV